MAILTAFEPIWLFATAGYAARRWLVRSDRPVIMLGWFVFHLAMPAALFVKLSRTPLTGFDARPLTAFAVSTAVLIALGWRGADRLFHRKPGERAIWGMAAGYVNAANLGIPVALQILGNISFIVQVLLFQTLIVSPVILVALDRHSDAAGQVRFRRTVTVPFRNPVILASGLGITASAVGIRTPPPLLTPLTLLATAALPAALIALGASLYRDEPAPDVRVPEIAAITVLKLLVQPALAFAIGLLLHLPTGLLFAVTVCAGLPTAQNSFVFAQRYGVGEAVAGRAVLVTTTLSLATIAGITALLGH